MKSILAIIIAVVYCLLCSCYTKTQAIKKFCNKDTITTFVTVHDTLRTKTIQADTTFTHTNDTVYLVRDKMVVKYYKKDSLVYLQGTCLGDTFYITKTVKVKVPVTVPKLVWYKQYAANYWWLLPLLVLLLVIVKVFHKWLNKK